MRAIKTSIKRKVRRTAVPVRLNRRDVAILSMIAQYKSDSQDSAADLSALIDSLDGRAKRIGLYLINKKNTKTNAKDKNVAKYLNVWASDNQTESKKHVYD